jgi:hypothetical protein
MRGAAQSGFRRPVSASTLENAARDVEKTSNVGDTGGYNPISDHACTLKLYSVDSNDPVN